MNEYGQRALDHDRTHHPARFATITDPQAHYGAVGERAQTAVTDLRDQILGPQRTEETLDQYRRRSHQALRQAEELVLHELLTPATEDASIPEEPSGNLCAMNDRLSQLAAAWTEPLDQQP